MPRAIPPSGRRAGRRAVAASMGLCARAISASLVASSAPDRLAWVLEQTCSACLGIPTYVPLYVTRLTETSIIARSRRPSPGSKDSAIQPSLVTWAQDGDGKGGLRDTGPKAAQLCTWIDARLMPTGICGESRASNERAKSSGRGTMTMPYWIDSPTGIRGYTTAAKQTPRIHS